MIPPPIEVEEDRPAKWPDACAQRETASPWPVVENRPKPAAVTGDQQAASAQAWPAPAWTAGGASPGRWPEIETREQSLWLASQESPQASRPAAMPAGDGNLGGGWPAMGPAAWASPPLNDMLDLLNASEGRGYKPPPYESMGDSETSTYDPFGRR